MDDGIAKDSEAQNELKQAVDGTISEKCIFGFFDLIDEQNFWCTDSFDPSYI